MGRGTKQKKSKKRSKKIRSKRIRSKRIRSKKKSKKGKSIRAAGKDQKEMNAEIKRLNTKIKKLEKFFRFRPWSTASEDLPKLALKKEVQELDDAVNLLRRENFEKEMEFWNELGPLDLWTQGEWNKKKMKELIKKEEAREREKKEGRAEMRKTVKEILEYFKGRGCDEFTVRQHLFRAKFDINDTFKSLDREFPPLKR